MCTHREYEILDADDPRWMCLVTSQPQAGVFYHPRWINLIAHCYDYHPFVLAICNETGRVTAGIPMMQVVSPWCGRRWVSLPYTDYCAPLYTDLDSLESLITGLMSASSANGIRHLELRWPYPSCPGLFTRSDHVLHSIDLTGGAEKSLGRISHRHARNVRIATKNHLQLRWGTGHDVLEAFYNLHIETRQRKGIPVQPWRFFDAIGHELLEKGLGVILLAYNDDTCLAGMVLLHWQKTLTYKFGASRQEGLNLRPNHLVFWSAIEWACQNGYELFDLGRTDLPDTGLREFKSGWGADETPLEYTFSARNEGHHPATLPISQVMKATIRHSPPWVCRLAGEILYGRFG